LFIPRIKRNSENVCAKGAELLSVTAGALYEVLGFIVARQLEDFKTVAEQRV
jgi:hypothetical protein